MREKRNHRWAKIATLVLVCLASGSVVSKEVSRTSRWTLSGPQLMELTVDTSLTPAQLLPAPAEELAGATWSRALRLLEVSGNPPRGAFLESGSMSWQGTLEEVQGGRLYWLLPPVGRGYTVVELSMSDLHLGGVPTSALEGGLFIGYQDGEEVVQLNAPPPVSSGGYSVQTERDTTLTASGGVYLQPPGSSFNRLTEGGGGQPAQPAAMPWMKIELDSVYARQGAKEIFVPLPRGGEVTLPPSPYFHTPPWGNTGDFREP